jgi:hypothetical protein
VTDKLEIVKAVAPFAAPLTAAIVEQWVKPKLAALYKYIKTDKALFENALATKFDEYLQRSYEKNSYINVIVFQNQRKRLDDLYIPITVKQAQDNKHILLDSYKAEFLPAYEKVLIKDTAGMGKSTVIKYLFLLSVRQNEGVPIFIELRKLKADESILDHIHNELNPIDDEFDKDFILKLIKQGGFIFFLDGYDEIPFKERDEVTRNLQEFISKASENHFVITSRPESSLASFADFQEFNIQPLKLEETFQLLRKYDQTGELSEEIISRLKGTPLSSLKEFLTNPLLVSLLYKSYEYKRIIPFKKHIYYRQVYDALFESHDLTKGGVFIREKYSGLDIEDFHKVLRALGFITNKLGQVELEKDRWLTLIREAKKYCQGITFKESDFLKDLLTTVPLFNRDGEYFKWSHKSLQDYFAAQFICIDAKGNQSLILRHIWKSEKFFYYYNVLDLCFDIDCSTFRKVIIYDLVIQFLKEYESSYTGIDREYIAEDSINKRKSLVFGLLVAFLPAGFTSKQGYRGDFDKEREYLEGKGISTKGYTELLSGGSPYVVVFEDYKRVIFDLLYIKKIDIFIGPFLTHPSERVERKVSKVLSKHLPYDSPIVVDDNPDSLINRTENFNLFTKYLEDIVELYLDYDKCVRF